jgi:hypothetical protein
LPVFVVSAASGGPWLDRTGADIGFALAATGYIGLVPTMLGNLVYLYGVAILGPGAPPLSSISAFSSAGWASTWPGTTSAVWRPSLPV